MTYDDLPDHPNPGVHLHCWTCNAETSATAGDYFMCNQADEIKCGECGDPVQLVRKTVKYTPITAGDA